MSRSRRSTVMLIEPLIVIAIIAVLIGLLLPFVQKLLKAINRATLQHNVREFGFACHSQHAPGRCSLAGRNNSFSVPHLPAGASGSQQPLSGTGRVVRLPCDHDEYASRTPLFLKTICCLLVRARLDRHAIGAAGSRGELPHVSY